MFSTIKKEQLSSIVKNDLPASIVVFLIALPLCLGIALASGAPLFSGIITGIIGGLVVSILSGSSLSVTGPAAGLTVIVLTSIKDLGAFDSFLMALCIAGILQLLFGFLKAGSIANFFPSGVIKGMLAAIGIILILKQIPHALGYDADFEGDEDFIQADNENTFTEIINAFAGFHLGAVIISICCFIILIGWENKVLKKIKLLPAPLIVVIAAILLNEVFQVIGENLILKGDHLVQVPLIKNMSDVATNLTFPNFSQWQNPKVYITAATIAIVASLETLLSIEAIDKLDPEKRRTPGNRELKAQGIGNILAGLIGGLPMTAVIVRGSANIN
ncbi:MAG TPA: SulP family inorganic anion transporter, partial [Cytophagaceae bacterium]